MEKTNLFATNEFSTANLKKAASIYNHSEPQWTIYHLLSAVTLGGGLLASVFGMLIILIFALVSREDQNLNYIGTSLLILAIPALMLGAHFMDKLEEKERQHRQAEVEKALNK